MIAGASMLRARARGATVRRTSVSRSWTSAAGAVSSTLTVARIMRELRDGRTLSPYCLLYRAVLAALVVLSAQAHNRRRHDCTLGTVIGGRYRLEAEIRRGAAACRPSTAPSTRCSSAVAIKLMHREIAADADQLERFRREARSVAQLNHPHIVDRHRRRRGARRGHLPARAAPPTSCSSTSTARP